MYTIHHATQWTLVRDQLQHNMNKMGYNPDLQRMLRNIDGMVVELSKLEVDARRTGVWTYVNEKCRSINNAIETVDGYITWGLLLK